MSKGGRVGAWPAWLVAPLLRALGRRAYISGNALLPVL